MIVGQLDAMRTSRIAKETSKVVQALSPSKQMSRRQTRSFAASISSFSANAPNSQDVDVKEEVDKSDDDDSSLSSVTSEPVFDIEEHPSTPRNQALKRKRGVDRSSTTITATSTSISTRISPRKAGIKAEGDEDRKVKKARRQPAKKMVNGHGEVEIHSPSNWEEIYEAVREMRKQKLAPVDTMGCETLAEENITSRVSAFNQRCLFTIVSLT